MSKSPFWFWFSGLSNREGLRRVLDLTGVSTTGSDYREEQAEETRTNLGGAGGWFLNIRGGGGGFRVQERGVSGSFQQPLGRITSEVGKPGGVLPGG